MKAVKSFTVRPHLPPSINGLDELAANLRWSWDRSTQQLFERIDPELWRSCGHDPRRVLALTDQARLEDLAEDPDFAADVDQAVAALRHDIDGPAWFDRVDTAIDGVVAYFSPEFGIAEAVPQYSGGLGVLAGDHLKSSSDLGVPLVGVGLFYYHGYFRQSVSADGWQQERYPDLDPYAMSLALVPDVRVSVELADETVISQVWKAQVGRTALYLLDTDLPENPDHLRTICDRLYGGDSEHRLRQEILLGIGGVRMLRAMGLNATVFHTNEGHAGFLGLERIAALMDEEGLDFDSALVATRASCVFTTHTPVPAGIDRFDLDLIRKYFGAWADRVGIPIERLIQIGHRPGDAPDERFNMAVMGMRLAERRNGVAQLHGEVSREMFADLWPGVPVEEVPIGAITNGVHGATWVSPEMAELFEERIGRDWYRDPDLAWDLGDLPNETLWAAHNAGTQRMARFVRRRLADEATRRGLAATALSWTAEVLDPEALTICFARRFATYKRATLLLSQPDRLRAMLNHPERPVQFVFAGKAHPADEPGKQLIRDIVTFSHDPEVRRRFCFVEDYDISVSRQLLAGADVWLNTPLRPQEACGTSGMKAAMNGGLNCSIADGWWAELSHSEAGWTIISAEGDDDLERRNELEANSLFDLLEQEVIPRYYDGRPPGGVSPAWAEFMRNSISIIGPAISSARMVRDYVTELYAPAAASVATNQGGGATAREFSQWQAKVRAAWDEVSVVGVDADGTVGDLNTVRPVTATVRLGSLSLDDVCVELITGVVGDAGELRHTELFAMEPDLSTANGTSPGEIPFRAELLQNRSGRRGLTVRVVPKHPLLVAPLEMGCVAWAH
jgi:starch phosphorylase